MTKLLRLLIGLVLASAVVSGVAACSLLGGSSAVPVATGTAPAGTDGAVNFDERYIGVGTGDTKVDIWFDAMCPYCGQFERANGDTLAAAVSDGSATVRLHPLTFLDSASSGTGYSTRAAAALACVGVHDPDRTLDYFRALFADQPEEGSSGLTDEQLAKRATDAGIADIAGCLQRSESYKVWAQGNTEQSVKGPITVDGKKVLDAIKGTPTVLVDGKQYTGDITDTKAFTGFLGG